MPTYRSITISLISQFDILTIPEYAPPTTPRDPFSNAPKLVNPDHSLVSVYIPTYPSSQFWLSYSISPPRPPKLLYYFKLYLNGNLVVSWGCGEDDDYRGKTMFGLFKPARTSGLARGATLERRVLCFCPGSTSLGHPPRDNLNDVMEIRVFRSKARKRIKPEVETLQSTGFSSDLHRRRAPQQQAPGGINLVNAGTLLDKHPQRYYKYALLDPLDTPFATFRYYYRSWDQLEALGVISPYASESSSVTSIDSSPNRSQQDIATTAERPLSPQDSSNTLESYRSVSASSDSTATKDVSQTLRDHKDDSIIRAPAPTNANENTPEDAHHSKSNAKATTTRATDDDDDSSPQSTTPSPDASPLKIPFFLPRPPTPPPQSASPRLHQLHYAIPPTTRDFTPTTTPLTSKESFASLIRNRLPDPDPSSFQLHNPAESPNDDARAAAAPPPAHPNTLPTAPQQHRTGSLGKRSGNGRMGVLMSVVNSAKSRRRREAAAGDSAASGDDNDNDGEQQPSEEGERTTDADNSESVSIGSGSEGSAKSKAGEKKKGEKKEKKKKEKVKAEKRDGDGAEEEKNDKQPKKRERKLNLWEEL